MVSDANNEAHAKLCQQVGLVWSGILGGADKVCKDTVDLCNYMALLVTQMKFVMDDLTDGAHGLKEQRQRDLQQVFLQGQTFEEDKQRLWEYLKFLSDLSGTFQYMQVPSRAFHVPENSWTMAWGRDEVPAAVVASHVDASIQSFLKGPVIDLD